MKINGFISTVMLTGLLLIATLGGITHAQDAADWMPDANLERAVRERLDIPNEIPMLPANMKELIYLEVEHDIESLKGLEHAINLEFLHLSRSKVSDLTPLAGLEDLHTLKLYSNRISDITPLAGLVNLTYLILSGNDISDTTSLAGLVNLEVLQLQNNQIADITPLAGLVNLKELYLVENQIVDISPLAGLVNLNVLALQYNQIVDISPLAGLVNLNFLTLQSNQIVDFTPIYGLVGIETLRLGNISINSEVLQILNPVDRPVVCDIAGDPILPRIEKNREYPSVFQAAGNIINLPALPWLERIAYHDLFFGGATFDFDWVQTPDGWKFVEKNREVGAKSIHQMRAQNPNLILLAGINYYAMSRHEYSEDWPYWYRDDSGKRLELTGWDQYAIDFTRPAAQEWFIQQAIEVAKCGVFDGIAIDHWTKALEGHITVEEADTAKDHIIQRIRDAVGEDFLILVTTTNTIGTTIPKHAEYINGVFMETYEDYEGGYTYARLSEIESALSWAEENLREPQINSLAGRGVRNELLDSPRNLQWMRLWTTLSLTHSDGYVMFTMGGPLDHPAHPFEFWPGHEDAHAQGKRHTHQNTKYWYHFYDAPLGRPIGGDETKAQLYENREGLFIREFTNGWAVYNRSGKEQEIELPQEVSGWSSGVKDKRRHTLADLDGEIYLKTVVQVAPGEYPPLYWINAKTGTLQRLVDTEVKNLVSGTQNAISLTVDTVNEKLYWTEKTGNRTGKIQSANLDGNPNIQLVRELTSAPLDIALDTAGEKLYLSNAWGKIQRMNLDGSNFQPNLITDLKAPQNLVLDTTNSKLYWTEQTGKTTGKVRRANLDGSNVQLVKKLTSAPRGMTLDVTNRKLYLTNAWGKIQRMNLDGSNFRPNFITGLVSPGQVAVDGIGGKLYWMEEGKLRHADLNGENIQDVITGLGELADLSLEIDSAGEMGVAAAPAAIRTVVEQTQLLANYPNPFNPETWIPYHLANPSEVTITIYDTRGSIIRRLDLGHQREGYYTSRSRAAYWDGRNAVGERVASGIYFYQLQADGLSYSRRMVIVK